MNSVEQLGRSKISTRSLSLENFTNSFCKKLLISKLSELKQGQVEIIDETGPVGIFGAIDAPIEHRTRVKINHPRAYSRIALGGSIGTGESYMDGDWETDQLTELVRVLVLNRDVLNSLDGGLGAVLAPLQKIIHRLRKNSIEGARKNIYAHYDLGNSFFELFLDKTWLYSCAIFKSLETNLDLNAAQFEKIDRICRKLDLQPGDHLLEIGTGWGSFAIHAAKNYGCQVTTTTISENQYAFAKKRIEEEGLTQKITLLFQDYRLLEGKFDKLASIEMIEAVGLDQLNVYFAKCSSLLKPDGKFVIQAITIRDQFYEQARKSVDFIQRYIFPGSGIPSIQSMSAAITRHSDMRITQLEDIGTHYATTLRMWSEKLRGNHDRVKELGYSEELYRMWQFYFSYCEGGFHERSISCVQIEMVKPANRH
jgi:cyclopropane-fatty-acyl-phospholipid synthase